MKLLERLYIEKTLLEQILKFVLISGIGWLIDFGGYFLLASVFGFSVLHSNLISTIPAFTFVFFVSVRHIFRNNIIILTLWQKYIFYFTYQIILVILISIFAQWLFDSLLSFFYSLDLSYKLSKFVIKIMITPITLLLNFIVMKILTEKI